MTQTFRGTVRYFRAEQGSGLAVVDIPPEVATSLGGLKQMRVTVTVNGQEFHSNTMPAGGGTLSLSLSQKLLDAAGLRVGSEGSFEVKRGS